MSGTAVSLRAANFLCEALLAGTAIVEAGELVECGQLIDFRREAFDFRERLDLLSELVLMR